MAKKSNPLFPEQDFSSHYSTFDKSRDILTFRPKINFIAPETEDISDQTISEKDAALQENTIEQARKRTEALISGYKQLNELAKLTQQRIDNRVAATGGVQVKLDQKKDNPVMAAMRRRFPQEDPSIITYEVYKQCLQKLRNQAPAIPQVQLEDIKKAKLDPYRTNFGGYSNQNGENRAEISSPANTVDPVDLSAFQSAAVIALFALMLPLIKKSEAESIATHLATAPHKPI